MLTLPAPLPTLEDDAVSEALEGHESTVDALRATGSMFWSRGWSVGTSSNYSTVVRREPLELVITASGMDKGRLSRRDFVRVDERGQPTDAGQPRSSAETLLHLEAVEDPHVGAVLHTHSIWGTLLSDVHAPQGGLLLEGYEMLKGLSGVNTHMTSVWVPIFENQQDIPALAEQVRRHRRKTESPLVHGYLIRRHGLYTWGRHLDEARRHVEIFEFLFECYARRHQWQGL